MYHRRPHLPFTQKAIKVMSASSSVDALCVLLISITLWRSLNINRREVPWNNLCCVHSTMLNRITLNASIWEVSSPPPGGREREECRRTERKKGGAWGEGKKKSILMLWSVFTENVFVGVHRWVCISTCVREGARVCACEGEGDRERNRECERENIGRE